MQSAGTYKQKFADKALKVGLMTAMGAYQSQNDRLRHLIDNYYAVADYDDRTAEYNSEDMSVLMGRNYEKALANLWKAEEVAPYLGFSDASRADKVAAEHGTIVGSALKSRHAKTSLDAESAETRELIEYASSDAIRKEFEDAYSPEQRESILQIVSLLGHGEAYALYTSSTLLPLVRGTGSKLGMAMQVMEEAKHFAVLRAMLRNLGGTRTLTASVRGVFETIARQNYFHKLFGMNIVLEGFATSLFSHFESYPGLGDIMRAFHMDESRHVAFPQSYAQAGNVPEKVTNSMAAKWQRLMVLAPAAGAFVDYKPHFDTINMDAYHFFGATVSKIAKSAETAKMPLPFSRKEMLWSVNWFFNSYVKAFEPEKYTGFEDYSCLYKGQLSDDMINREREVYGKDLYRSIWGRRRKNKNARKTGPNKGLISRAVSAIA